MVDEELDTVAWSPFSVRLFLAIAVHPTPVRFKPESFTAYFSTMTTEGLGYDEEGRQNG
jgi:hypothetical protein